MREDVELDQVLKSGAMFTPRNTWVPCISSLEEQAMSKYQLVTAYPVITSTCSKVNDRRADMMHREKINTAAEYTATGVAVELRAAVGRHCNLRG